jgi:hypothetical protein
MPVLTAIDVLGVQRYIFSSNRLRDVVMGSYLVGWSASHDRSGKSGVRRGALSGLAPKNRVLLAGGGNALIEFDDYPKAREFTARYTRLIHQEAPGLEVAIAHREYQAGNLARALGEIGVELARTKTERAPSVPLLGLSVTVSCNETGLPACGFDKTEPTAVPISRGILARRGKREDAIAYWQDYLSAYPDFDFPMELDDLGRTMGDTSLIGVVHLDGNGVGKRIAKWVVEKRESGAPDEEVRQQYREWSEGIDRLGNEALKVVVDHIVAGIKRETRNSVETMRMSGRPESLGFDLKKKDQKWMLPIRPILLGGDDLTFVCDARIALDCAETALQVFERSEAPHLGKITACAGTSIVGVHVPFARAYQLAEKLCASAKSVPLVRTNEDCALDWHIGLGRPDEGPESIRERQYRRPGQTRGQSPALTLTCRPYRLGADANDKETWRWLSQRLVDDSEKGFRGTRWAARRNKVKAFAELAREGPDAVKAAVESWRAVDRNLVFSEPLGDDGFFDKSRTPLLDAVELLDLRLAPPPAKFYPGEEELVP